MEEFFRGWKRKLGLVTLMLACASMAGWLRSSFARDYAFFLNDNYTTNRLVSFNGSIAWERFHQAGEKRLTRLQFSEAEVLLEYDQRRTCEWNWMFLGFGQGTYKSEDLDLYKQSNPDLPFEGLTQSIRVIPYWSVVLPLTLLSTWLLLSKPRARTPRPVPKS